MPPSQNLPAEAQSRSMAQQVAEAAAQFQLELTGHKPSSVIAIISGDTLVITLGGALTPAERDLARDPTSAAKVRELHRQLFITSAGSLRQEIKRITGVDVREAAAEVEPATGTIVHAFTSGTMVQVFQLSESISPELWNSVIASTNSPTNP